MVAVGSVFSFTYSEMLSMDMRDLLFFERKARKEVLMRYLYMVQASRLAQATDNYYSQEVELIKHRLKSFDVGREDLIKEGWENMKGLKNRV